MMRIACPECGALYEVTSDAIPPEGRDVQCSNCHHIWLQPALTPVPEAAYPKDDGWDDPAEDTPEPPAAQGAEAPRRAIDPDILAVLQAERSHEDAQRASERGGLETQPDLGLDVPDQSAEARRAREARETLERMQPPPAPVAAAPVDPVSAHPAPSTPAPQQQQQPAAGSIMVQPASEAFGAQSDQSVPPAPPLPQSHAAVRRSRLPAVEDVDSTLHAPAAPARRIAMADPHQRPPATALRGNSGFAQGFYSAVLAVVVMGTLYVSAADLGRALPGLAPQLGRYVATLDAAHGWIAGQVTDLRSRMATYTAASNG